MKSKFENLVLQIYQTSKSLFDETDYESLNVLVDITVQTIYFAYDYI